MKILLLCFSIFLSVTANGNSHPYTLLDQLAGINKYWLKNEDALLKKIHPVNLSETELIRLHLQLVEKNLRSRTTAHLNASQQSNRSSSLDILHSYWQRGLFPQNIFHTNRTPYFIDHLNVACAVGYLIIETGHGELAGQISKENNYAFIEDMDYPEMQKWADKYGFTIDELKWIQPAYSCDPSCTPDTILHVSCFGHYDGCIGIGTADLSIYGPDKVFTYENVLQYNEVMDSWFEPHPSYNLPCDLGAGYYKLIFKDQFNVNYEFFYDLLQPDELISDYGITPAGANCLGMIEAAINGGVPPYQYMWSTGDTTAIITDLCFGVYHVTIVDATGCLILDEINVSFQTSTEDLSGNNIKVYPNPVSDKLNVELKGPIGIVDKISIHNALGVKIYNGVISEQNSQIDISFLPDGVYFVVIPSQGHTVKKFVKSR